MWVVSAQLESGKGPPLLTRDQRLVQINKASDIRKQRQLSAQLVKRKHQEAKAEQQLAMVGCKSAVLGSFYCSTLLTLSASMVSFCSHSLQAFFHKLCSLFVLLAVLPRVT